MNICRADEAASNDCNTLRSRDGVQRVYNDGVAQSRQEKRSEYQQESCKSCGFKHSQGKCPA